MINKRYIRGDQSGDSGRDSNFDSRILNPILPKRANPEAPREPLQLAIQILEYLLTGKRILRELLRESAQNRAILISSFFHLFLPNVAGFDPKVGNPP